jgi:hypothetical protein
MHSVAPLLPASYFSAFVTYWLPMNGGKFMSSGNVWFDYGAKCFRIDGLFNPWDVESTKQHLWISELSHYGRGISYHISLAYDRVQSTGVAAEYTIESRSLKLEEVPIREAIFPQDYLQEAGATKARSGSLLGIPVDVWTLPQGNRLDIQTIYLRKDGNELVRMEQKKRGDVVIRDFPNFVSGPIDPHVFDRKNHAFALQSGAGSPSRN